MFLWSVVLATSIKGSTGWLWTSQCFLWSILPQQSPLERTLFTVEIYRDMSNWSDVLIWYFTIYIHFFKLEIISETYLQLHRQQDHEICFKHPNNYVACMGFEPTTLGLGNSRRQTQIVCTPTAWAIEASLRKGNSMLSYEASTDNGSPPCHHGIKIPGTGHTHIFLSWKSCQRHISSCTGNRTMKIVSNTQIMFWLVWDSNPQP